MMGRQGSTTVGVRHGVVRVAAQPDWSATAFYLATSGLGLLLGIIALRVWDGSLHVPFATGSDAAYYAALIKNFIEHGSINVNSSLGAPWIADLHDFPAPHTLHFLVLRLLALFTHDYAVVMNLYFLLTFPLCALTAGAVLRQLGLSRPFAMAGALAYTLLPYHFLRGEVHLFLASYYMVPPALLVAVWVASGERLFVTGKMRPTGKGAASLAICALVGCDNPYYAFFSAFFLIVASGIMVVRQRRLGRIVVPALLLSIIIATLLLNLLPNVLYSRQHGTNAAAAQRYPYESELYGLKLVQMLLPITGHRVERFADIKDMYNAQPNPIFRGYVNENDCASLGLIAGTGLLLAIGWALFAKGQQRPLISDLGVLAVSGLLLGTVGGFGTLFALTISPQIRSYNRISIFLGFLAIAAVQLLVDDLTRKYRAWPRTALAVVLVGIAFFDQTTPAFVPHYKSIRSEFANDERFVKAIENELGRGAMVFQLPYVGFPGTPRVGRMAEYDHFRGFLHSRTLRWSFGAMRGRAGDAWLRKVTAEPLPDLVETVALAGFEGIYLDSYGYGDSAHEVEAKLSSLLGTDAITSDNGRLLFFDLRPYTQRLRSSYSVEAWSLRQEAVLHPLLIDWIGFSPVESDGSHSWRRCTGRGDIHIFNTSAQPRNEHLSMTISAGPDGPSRLSIEAPGIRRQLRVNGTGQKISEFVHVPPGDYVIRLQTGRGEGKTTFRVEDFNAADDTQRSPGE